MRTIQLQHTRVFQSLWTSQKRINCFRGGARSSKTWSILQAIAIWQISGYFGKQHIPTGICSIVRETLPSLRASSYKDYVEILHSMQMYNFIDHRKTLLELEYQNRTVQFFSTDDLNSAKLRGRQSTIAYINEANSGIPFESFNQIIMRCTHFMILDYNPSGVDNWVKTYLEDDRMKWPDQDVKLDISTYKDNPHIPIKMVNEIEGLAKTDIDLYNVYSKGQWVQSRNLVFEKINICQDVPQGKVFFGLDFGYNDPSVCCRVTKVEDRIYIEQIFFRTKMLLKDIAEELHAIGVHKVYADNEVRTIKELRNRGIRIKPAKKGKDSIRQGLGFIRTHQIFIHEESLETIKEFREYKYKLDENNNPTDICLDRANHSVDAVRYALSYALRGAVTIR